MKYAVGGVAFSGNKGAEGMLIALMQHINELDQNAEFYVVSYYPGSDKIHEKENVHIVKGSPKCVVLYFFQSVWCKFCRLLHLPSGLWKRGDFAMIAQCDLFLDAAGISFCDGREKFTVFNILTILPALSSGVPVIKVSQAMGPFRHKTNRFMAKLILPHLALITARGEKTRSFLDKLNLRNVVSFSDSAFSLECTPEDVAVAEQLLPAGKNCPRIGISPSQVVYGLCEKCGVDYLSVLKDVVLDCRKNGYQCILFPHSARTGTEKTHNNDLPLLQRFASQFKEMRDVIVLDQELEAGVLRCLIAKMDLLIASRFHAVISAMAVGVPAIVIGWSHKYAEVLAPFHLDEYVQPYAKFNSSETSAMVRKLLQERDSISQSIRKETVRIRQKNQDFFKIAVRTASARK